MQYELRVQDPADPPRSPLFDELVALVNDGEVAWLRMFFGFLTGSGMDTLLGVPEVRDVLLHSEVEVLVGLDAVTDRLGLKRLLELAGDNPKFKPLVIKHSERGLVHPKMLVVRYTDGRTVVVVGSNNLSSSGLSRNVEGYTIARFEPEEPPDLSDWDEFIRRRDPLIGEIDDEALKAAEQNERRLKRLRTAVRGTRTKPNSGVVVSDGQVYEVPVSEIEDPEDLEDLVHVAQIPKGGNRWSQVGYSAQIIRDYFDVEAGDELVLRSFGSTQVETPRVVNPKSNKNHRIELGAARRAGEYPEEGPPVVLFRREEGALRHHRYVLLMPGDQGHSKMTELAKKEFKGPVRQVSRAIVPLSRVMTAWPGCPL